MRVKVKFRYLLYLLPVFAAVIALLLWLFQPAAAAYLLKKLGGTALKAERVEGSLADGFILYGVRFKTAAFSAYAPRAVIRPDLRAFLRGKPAVSELIIAGAVIKIAQAPAARPVRAAEKNAPGLPAGLEIKNILLEDCRVELPPKEGERYAVTGIAGRLSFKNGRVSAQSLRGEYRGVALALSGEYGEKGLNAGGDAAMKEPALRLRFDYALSGAGHSLRAAGRLKSAAVRFSASLDSASRWTLKADSSGLPLSLARAGLPDLAFAASVEASGRYLDYEVMTASAQFRANLPRAAVFEGVVKTKPGTVRLDAALRSPEARGSLSVEYAAGALDGTWELGSAKALSFPLEKTLAVASFRGEGKITGGARAPVVTWAVSAASAAYGAAGAGIIVTRGELSGGDEPLFNLSAEAENIFSGGRALGSAQLKSSGTPAANTLAVSLSSVRLGAELAGTSAFQDGAWQASWTSLLLKEAPAWRLCGPFSTSLSKTRRRLSGFCASDGKARAAFSVNAAGGEVEYLALTLSDLSLESFETLGKLPLPPGGLVSARADYRKGDTDGTLEISGTDLRVKNMDFGSVRLSGGFNKERVEIRQADWKVYNGLLSAAGTAALGGSGPDLHFVVTASSLNVAPLLVFAPELKAEMLFLNGGAEIILKGSALTNRGGIRFDSPQLEVIPLGLKLTQLRVSARGEEGLAASITASAKTRSGGSVTARGLLGAPGPDIEIKARKLPFSTQTGFSGIADCNLDFHGTWKLPSLSGLIDFPESRFDMEQWRGAPPAGPRSAYYESLAMDIKVKSERNAWYRDTPNSIEAKGDLILKKPPYNPLAVIGTVEALKGFYTYLGNTFTIQNGTLVFGGEIPPDPKIEVSAANAPRGSPIKVYLRASGTFRNPKLELSSDPELEQRDIMSYLLTGKPLYEFSRKPGDQPSQTGVNGSQIAAANIVANYLYQKAAGTLVRKLDIDVLNLRMTSEKEADITVGRYLTPDLFISYGQVLSPGGEKRVAAEYTITPWWSLEGKNSSQGSYVVDLLFKFGIRTVRPDR